MTTSIILPTIARKVWISEPGANTSEQFPIPAQPFNKTIKLGSTIGLAAGRGAVAIRIFAADASSQSGSAESAAGSAALYLAGDDRGMPLGAIRLVAYHYRGHYMPPDPATAAGKHDTHLRFGALMKAAAVPLPTSSGMTEDTVDASQEDVMTKLVQSLVAAEITSTTATDQSGSKVWHVSAFVDPTEPTGSMNTNRLLASGSLRQDTTSSWEKVRLAVDRNLTCSESLTPDKNQSSEQSAIVTQLHSHDKAILLAQVIMSHALTYLDNLHQCDVHLPG